MRIDIQYLRTLAVLGVVLFHLWPGKLTGGYVGVDIFFVISGFLITSHLVKELVRDNKISFAAFYARRARRILPAAIFVLIATFFGVLLFSLSSDWPNFFKQILGSALFSENWILAADSVDYLAADSAPSPVQHYWSLSAEEQFYLLWPLLTFAIFKVSKLRGAKSLAPLTAGLTALASISLLWSVYQTATDAPPAYFSTFTRAWEFAIGGIVAVIATKQNSAPKSVRHVVAILGWAGLLLSCVWYSPATPFPSYTALLPVLSTAAVIWSSVTQKVWIKPFKWVQDLLLLIAEASFSLYLWHWPVIIFAKNYLGRETSTKENIVLLVVSVVLAWLTTRFVEAPFRFSKLVSTAKPRNVLMGALAALAVVSMTFGSSWAVSEKVLGVADRAVEAAQKPLTECSGAGILIESNNCAKESFKNLTPDPLYANSAKSKVATGTPCADYSDKAKVVTCVFGDPTSKFKVALLGDSHAMAMFPAIEKLAIQQGWSLTTYLRSACPFIARPFVRIESTKMQACSDWNVLVREKLAQDNPYQLVFVTGNHKNSLLGEDAYAVETFRMTWQPLIDQGSKMVVIRDVPRMTNALACLQRKPAKVLKCSLPTSDKTLGPDRMVMAAKGLRNTFVVDLTKFICPDDLCRIALGGVTTYRDNHHITAPFAETLAPMISEQLANYALLTKP